MAERKITKLEALEILDSRGNPTVQVTAWAGKVFARASVPSGASTGSYEAHELRDGGKRYGGLGVLKACKNVTEKIAKVVVGLDARKQEAIDEAMRGLDGTADKRKLGANAILGVSLAACRLSAYLENVPLYERIAALHGRAPSIPAPLFNVINGGVHADSGLDIQEFMLVPLGGAFPDRLREAADVYRVLRKKLIGFGMTASVGDEGGFAPKLKSNEAAFDLLEQAVKDAGYKVGRDFAFGIDAASSEFYDAKTKTYNLKASKKTYTATTAARLYQQWQERFRLAVIEDPLAEDDFLGWKLLTQALGSRCAVVGDDLFVTNPARIRSGIQQRIANTVLIKPNQIGTVSETLEAVRLAQDAGYKVVVSHRSGETTDRFIADLAVGVGANYLKAGAPCRGERLAKYNRLLEICEELKGATIAK